MPRFTIRSKCDSCQALCKNDLEEDEYCSGYTPKEDK